MFEKVVPEQVGVSSQNIKEYVEHLEKHGFATHSIVMVRHGKVFYEAYWAPFHREFKHRIYSDSKSYVSLAIGFLAQDGLIDLEQPVVSYFDKSITEGACENVKKQTVKDMLMMRTGFPADRENWFGAQPQNRLKWYFETSQNGKALKVPGTLYYYDSSGSFVLGALVEAVTGKSFDEYMHEKLYSQIGVASDTYTLKCPGGNAWGDSGIMISAIDQAKVMMFVMNNGKWCGKQILDEHYVKTACSALSDNSPLFGESPDKHGYGYQIWRTRDNGIMFNGMASQFAVAVPEKDLVFVINSDNHGTEDYARREILNGFFDVIVNRIDVSELPENSMGFKALCDYSEHLHLYSLRGSEDQEFVQKINGKQFIMKENPMGITKIKFTFNGDEGTMHYTNAQGDKKLNFAMNRNAFGVFPQEGYADMVGNVYTPNHYYKCAASAKILDKNSMAVLVQIIDKYFGKLCMKFGFTDEGDVSVIMERYAEHFMNEYIGWASGTIV